MKIGELFVRLGVQADTFTVKDFVSAIGQIPFSVGAAVTSLAGMSLGFMDLTHHTLELSNNLSLFRSETGLSTDELQRWQGVAKQVGLSGDVVSQSIMGITNALAQIRLGHGESLLPFGRLGVNIRGKSAFEILQQIGENSQRMDPNIARSLMGQIGVSPEMMRIFSLGSGQFNRMAAREPELGERDIAAMNAFQEELGRFNIIVERSFVPALTAVEPYMGNLAEALADLIILMGRGAGLLGGSLQWWKDPKQKFPGLGMIVDALIPADPQNLYGTRTFHQVVTQNITSTADPEEVARIVNEGLRREKVGAAKSLDNQGY